MHHRMEITLNDLPNMMMNASERLGDDSPYVNVLAVNAGHERDPQIRAVAEALNAPALRQFILTKYQGALVPAF